MTDKRRLDEHFEEKIPLGEDRLRSVCGHCGFIDYKNPKIVVGSVAVWEEKILLCKRAIEPRKGYWTIPAGYLELNETPEAGAKREALEEACARIDIDCVLALYSVPHISQVQIMYRARLMDPDVAVGPESQEVMLTHWADIPWADIAFPSAKWALNHWRQTINAKNFAPFGNPPEKSALGDVK